MIRYILHSAVQDETFPNEYFDNLDIVADRAIRLAQDCFGVSIHISEYLGGANRRLRIDKETPKYKIKEFFAMQPKSTTTKNKIRFFQPCYNNTEGGLRSLETMFSKLFNENEIYSQKILMNKLEQQKEKIFNYLIEAYTKSVYLNETEE